MSSVLSSTGVEPLTVLREAAAAARPAAAAAAAAENAATVAAQPHSDPLAFYVVAATIIPVLFLALIYQSQLLESREFDDSPITRAIVVVVVSVLAVQSEYQALLALATGVGSNDRIYGAATGVMAVGVALVLGIVLQALENVSNEQARERFRNWAGTGAIVWFLAGVATLLFNLNLPWYFPFDPVL